MLSCNMRELIIMNQKCIRNYATSFPYLIFLIIYLLNSSNFYGKIVPEWEKADENGFEIVNGRN